MVTEQAAVTVEKAVMAVTRLSLSDAERTVGKAKAGLILDNFGWKAAARLAVLAMAAILSLGGCETLI